MWRPSRDLSEALSGVAVLVFLGAVGFILARILTGCTPRTYDAQYPSYCYEEALYTAAQLRCVDAARDLGESRECRRKLAESCGIAETVTVRR